MTADDGRCIKCGRPVGARQTLCPVCNRAGMQTPSASQYHGTIVVAIILGVVGLAVAASLTLRGVGPFRGTVLAFSDSPAGGVEVTVEVRNQGTRSGRATCQVVARDESGRRLGSATAESPPVEGGGRVSFATRLPGVEGRPGEVIAECE